MKTSLSFKHYLYLGIMLFGMLFGAGNLIFPIHMGQLSGAHFQLATLGFLVSAIGLPFLAFIALGVSKSPDILTLAHKVNRPFAFGFTLLLYLVLGPLFALPRLATTSFTIGIAPFVTTTQQGLGLGVYTLLFFLLAFLLALNPHKLMDYIGKYLTPAFLAVLGILLTLVVIKPMGNVALITPTAPYDSHPFVQGFLDGYQTLDVLAASAFGIVVIQTLNDLNVTEPKAITFSLIKAGSISMLVMALIYWLIALAGANSMGTLALSENGGIALAQIAHHYLGTSGNLLLALIVILGCLKTTIGLLTACAEAFAQLFPRLSYRIALIGVSLAAGFIAMSGLTAIIDWAVPVLMFLYPLAIPLVILAVIHPLFEDHRLVYQYTIGFSLIPALLDAVVTIPSQAPAIVTIKTLALTIQQWLPFGAIGMGWLIPALVGFCIGYLLYRRNK